MLDQLVQGFGSCVLSTIRRKFPSTQTRSRSQATQNLLSTDTLNSIIGLNYCTTPNSKIEYRYWSTNRGVTLRYDLEGGGMHVIVQYAQMYSIDTKIYQFYGVALEEERVSEVNRNNNNEAGRNNNMRRLIGQEFDAHECIFCVISCDQNMATCQVTDCYNVDVQSVYTVESHHTFEIDFVQEKITEYLS